MAQLNFNPSNITIEDKDFEPLPAGWYTAIITESSLKTTKDGTGSYYEFKYRIISEKYKNRGVYMKHTRTNKNEKAVHIGQQQITAICKAIDKMNCTNTEELHNIPLDIKVFYIPAQNGFGARNEVKFFRKSSMQQQQSSTPPWAGGNDDIPF